MNEMLFHSVDSPIPPIRRDLQIIPMQHNGDDILFFQDALGHAPDDFALNQKAEPILSLINGSFSVEKICELTEGQIEEQELIAFVRLLDQNCLLDSPHYRQKSRKREESFEAMKNRPPALAGISYPADPEKMNAYLKNLFAAVDSPGKPPEKGLYAPHIDLKVGEETYAKIFSALKDLTPSRVVILATAHYTGYYPGFYSNIPFIGSHKVFELPGTTIQPDLEYLDQLEKSASRIGYSSRDRAHRIEHSIETHLLFISYLWSHEFSIVPILVNSFDDLLYHPQGHLGNQLQAFSLRLQELDDDNTIYLISGDLSHVGRKFGDSQPAARMRSDVERFDREFLSLSANNKSRRLLELISREEDRFRICGFPPLYTFLQAFPDIFGTAVDYSWWDERERESAVSYGAILF